LKQLTRVVHRTVQWLPVLFLSSALAGPVEVGFTVSGKPKQWTLDFWVKNNMSSTLKDDMHVFVFGLELPAESAVAAPGGFEVDRYDHYSHSGAGGSSTQYNRAWVASAARVVPSQTVSGFLVQLDQVDPPTSVSWFVLARSDSRAEYQGDGHFGNRLHPGFEGLAVAAVPEPATYGLFGVGLACVAVAGYRGRCRTVSAEPD
jgi:hypothetical protein